MNSKINLFALSILISGSAFAESLSCYDQGLKYSSQISEDAVNSISSYCLDQVYSIAPNLNENNRAPASLSNNTFPKNYEINREKKIEVFSLENILVVRKDGKENIYAGSKTGLKFIEAVTVDPSGDTVAVLNRGSSSKQVLVFSTKYSGNIRPQSVISGKEINPINSIAFSQNGKEIYLNDGVNKKLLSVEKEKDSRKQDPALHPVFNERLVFNKKDEVSYIKSSGDDFLYLNGQFLHSVAKTFDKGNWTLDLSVVGATNPKGFYVSNSGKEIKIVTNKNGVKTVQFPGK
ncbi:hypothetical protein HBN50_05145 [Halobacteriovorax sp. GB3]|uniref:hypothetical protein n=1 Tax=Halobacteriovorax sp. GB3 TaxID=2719615 RepID=UPI00235E81EB|nr:hypothetical protein [Halobacteriovorax sp. GB3]MDD0852471.1 hypothetical protein [Halobacteriovorax sp. GB3]